MLLLLWVEWRIKSAHSAGVRVSETNPEMMVEVEIVIANCL